MPGVVIGGPGRAGKDELAGIYTVVDGSAHVIPNLRSELPLVDQPRYVAREDQPWIERRCLTSIGFDVEQYLARGNLACRLGLSACLCTLDQYSAARGQLGTKLTIGNS